MTLFLRLLSYDDKATALAGAITALREGRPLESVIYTVDPASLRQVPGSPFAYWVSERIRRLFTELPPFEGDGRTVKQGLATTDDFRFVRAWWEVAPVKILHGANGPDWQEDLTAFQEWCRQRTFEGKRWMPFAKGGAYSPYYADSHLIVDWERDGEAIKEFVVMLPGTSHWSRRVASDSYYFRPGLTWSERTAWFSLVPLPAGCIFSVSGKGLFTREPLYAVQAVLGSSVANYFLRIYMARSGLEPKYQAGDIQRLPCPPFSRTSWLDVQILAAECVSMKCDLNTADETSHVFYLPALLQVTGDTLADRIVGWEVRIAEIERQLNRNHRKIDDIAFHLYSIEVGDRQAIEESLSEQPVEGNNEGQSADTADEVANADHPADSRQLVADLLSYAVGCAFGRWDVRLAMGERETPELPDPFAPLPVCSRGMLCVDDGLPLQEAPSEYPLRIYWDGIVVDDPGFEGTQPHWDDIVRRVREVIDLLWGNSAEAIEQETCTILGVRDLREYFRRPPGFFQDHLKRYSKSRRKAPIYWPLSTASGSYTVGVYYQRLTDQTLYIIVNRYVEPKIAEVERAIAGIEKDMATASGRQATQLRDHWQESRAFLSELHDFRQELLRVAALPYKPNLNDGVIINAAPLHRLFRHRQWAKETRDCWERLERREYEWAHMAFTIWPERVREVCRRDRSIAIAHGLEALYEPASPSPGRRRRRQQG